MLKRLLNDLITFEVVLTTNLKQTIQLANGEVTEVSLIVEGILLDYDREYLLMCSVFDPEDLELIQKAVVVSIKRVDKHKQKMDDLMSRETNGAMN
jgi:hypothetical protein